MGNRERFRMVTSYGKKKKKKLSNFLLGVAKSISLSKKKKIYHYGFRTK
jgi:hypothetical protein